MTKMAMTLSPQSMHEMLRAFGFGEVTGSGFPGESAGTALRRIALAQDRAGDDFLRLRPVGHAAAAGARVRDSRRRRHPSSGDAASRRRPGAGRARHRRARRARAAADDGKRRVAGRRNRRARCARRLSRCRQNRDSVDRRCGRILDRTGTRRRSAASCPRAIRGSPRSSSSTSPADDSYYGGDVAAPVFANVMAGALRLLGVPPDGLDRVPATTLVQASREP